MPNASSPAGVDVSIAAPCPLRIFSPTRRSVVVSKAKRMVDASIALFARFAGNGTIGELLSVLT